MRRILSLSNTLKASTGRRAFSNTSFTASMNYKVTTPEVLIRKQHGGRLFILNRPKAYNALTLSMIRIMTPQLQAWSSSDLCSVIVIKSETPKAFCAGGDVKEVVRLATEKDPKALQFFEEEYQLNHLIGTTRKPIVAIMNGITMGGGVGISVHAPFRIATENTVFAMPETKIGFFPDVGGTFFLPRMDGKTGNYLALTGAQLKGEDVLYAGIATHFVPSNRLPALEERLCELDSDDPDMVNHAIEEYVGEPSSEGYSLNPHREKIDSIFKHSELEAIFSALEKDGSVWSLQQLETLKKMSPSSLRITMEQLKQGIVRTFSDCFRLEYHLVQRVLAHPDFYEGVTALLVDKRDPVWSPASLKDIPIDTILQQYYFITSPKDLLLQTEAAQPVNRKYGLPTEDMIRKLINGEDSSSGSGKWKTEEVVTWFEKEWQKKKWVKEKVAQVLQRKTEADKEGYLSWKK